MLPFKLVYHEGYDLRLGEHVFQSQKFGMVRDALLAEGIAEPADILSPEPASDEDILRVHTREWVEKLQNDTLTATRTDAPGDSVFAEPSSEAFGWPRAARFWRRDAHCATVSDSISAADFTMRFPATAKASA